MSDALDVLDQVGKWKSSGKGVAIATVITTWGSSPRPVGSQLGVDDSGAMVGSVSGGCIEGAVVQEALANVAKHAPGAWASVRIDLDDGVEIDVLDDGPGAPANGSGGPGHGLVGMKERVEALGGRLIVGPGPNDHGWRVRAVLP